MTALKFVEQITATGHPNITATHPTTLEFTKESSLTKKGDCIVAVNASKGLMDLSEDFRATCRNDNARIVAQISSAGVMQSVRGKGSKLLTLNHSEEIVIRKSTYVSERTLMLNADSAAIDLKRSLVRILKSPSAIIKIKLTVEV